MRETTREQPDAVDQANAPGGFDGVPPRPRLTTEERVEFFLARGYSVAKIARKTRMSAPRVKEIVDRIDEAKIQEVIDGDEVARARMISYHELIAQESMEVYLRSKRNKKPQLRYLKVGMEAQKQIREMLGLDAPAKSVNLNLTAKPLVMPGDQQAFVNADPNLMAEMVRLKAEQRALMARMYRPAAIGGPRG